MFKIANAIPCNISIESPFGESVYIEAKSQSKALANFKFMNTRLDHVELNELTARDTKHSIEVTRDELKEKLEYYRVD